MRDEVVWDARWKGQHGIARHAREVSRRFTRSYRVVESPKFAPTSPLDPLYLRSSLRLGKRGLFVSPGYNASIPAQFGQLLTIHDLIHLRVPQESSRAKRVYYEKIVRPAVRTLGKVLTVSEFTRCELAQWTGLDLEQIVVVGNGCTVRAASEGELRQIDESARKNIVVVGNDKPHKNLALVIAALRYVPAEMTITCVGASPQYVRRICSDLDVDQGRVRILSRISDEDLRKLYIEAACVALPSTYEGFGLAAVEAMAVGTATAYVCQAVDEVTSGLGARSTSFTDGRLFGQTILAASERRYEERLALVRQSRVFDWNKVAERVEGQIADCL